MRPLTDEIIETVLSLATTMRIIRDLLKEATETLDEAKGKDMRKCQGIVYYGINHGPADRTAHKFVCLLSANHAQIRCVLWPVDQ